jgi:hypothetical protein
MFDNFLNLFYVYEFPTVLDKIYFFFVWLLIWTSYFLLVNNSIQPEKSRKVLKKQADDIRNRMISITHGLFSFLMTGYHIIKHCPQYNEPITNFQHILILISVAYFTYDMIACTYYGLTDFGLYFHHCLVIFGYATDEYYGYGGTETLSIENFIHFFYFIFLVGLFFAEISNCPMHIRKILRSLGLRYTNSHECFEFIYFSNIFEIFLIEK